MATVSTIISVASLVIGAATTAYSITQQQKQTDQAKEQAEDQAKREAQLIRERAQRAAGAQEAQLAGSGVKLGTGLGAELPAETIYLAERDALQVMKDARRQGALIQSQANANSVGTGLAGASKMASSAYSLFGPAGSGGSSTGTPAGGVTLSAPRATGGPSLGVDTALKYKVF